MLTTREPKPTSGAAAPAPELAGAISSSLSISIPWMTAPAKKMTATRIAIWRVSNTSAVASRSPPSRNTWRRKDCQWAMT